MALFRKTFRDLIETKLKAKVGSGLALEGVNVYNSRIDEIPLDKLPAINIRVATEEAESLGMHLPRFQATVEVDVEMMVHAKSGYADDLDSLEENVRSILFTDPNFIKQFEDIVGYRGSIGFNQDDDGKTAISLLTIRARVTEEYTVDCTDFGELDDLRIKVDLIDPTSDPDGDPGPDGVIEAEVRLDEDDGIEGPNS